MPYLFLDTYFLFYNSRMMSNVIIYVFGRKKKTKNFSGDLVTIWFLKIKFYFHLIP